MAALDIAENDPDAYALDRLAEPDAASVEEHLLVWPGAAGGVGSVRRGDAGCGAAFGCDSLSVEPGGERAPIRTERSCRLH